MNGDERIIELSQLQDGWLDGEGKAPSADVVKRARQILATLQRRPGIFPTETGGIQFEWDSGAISFEIEPDETYHLWIFGFMLQNPEPEILADDLVVETFDVPGTPVNEGPRGVRMTHRPTGIVVECGTERSQLQNKVACLEELRERLADD